MKALQWTTAAFVLGLGLVLLLAQMQARRNDERVQAELQRLVDHYVARVQERVGLYRRGLQGTRAAIAAVGFDDLTARRFAAYAHARDFETEFPGSVGFGFIRRVPERDVARFVEAARAEDRPSFDIRMLAPHAGDRFVIQYIEPETPNRSAIGLDIASEPARRAAAEIAARTGLPQLTDPITLAQAPDRPGRGFLLLFPIYRQGAATDTPEQRLAATVGWIYTPLLIDRVLGDVVSRGDAIRLALHDVTRPAPDPQPFFVTAGRAAASGATRRSATVEVYGHRWRLEVAASDALAQRLARPTVMTVLSVGIGVDALVCALLYLGLSSTERRRKAREAQEALARGVVNASPQAIVVVDAQGRIVRANRRLSDVFGYAPESVPGKPVEMLVPAAHRALHQSLRAHYDRVERPMTSRGQLMGLHASGKEFPIRVHLSPLEQGDERLVIAGVLDVSMEVAALEQAKASEARWRELANSMPQLVWTCRADGPCEFLSAQWIAYTGLPEHDQLGYGWLQQVHPEDRGALEQRWQAAVDTRSVFHVEFRIRRHDGVYRWFDTQAVPLLDAKGDLLRWVGSNTDIEDRVRAEKTARDLNATLENRIAERTAALEAARRDLRNILDAIPSMVGYWDAAQRNRFANRAYVEWFGVDAEHLQGRHLSELVGPVLYELNRPHIEAALRGEPQTFEREITSSSGVTRSGLANYVPDVVDGQVRGFYVLVHDVTEIRRAREAAEASNRAKSLFLANMSHEIRTPVNAVINLTYLLEKTVLVAEQRELVSKVRLAGRALLGVINDILDLSKIEAGEMRVDSAAFDLPRVVHDVAKLMSAAAEEKGLALDVRIEAAVHPFVRGDGLRVAQMLSNLVSNAIKFTEHGRVSVAVEPDVGGHTLFSVVDTGIGVQPHVLERLFRPFTQGDASTTRRFGGTGLGLAIVYRLANLMGGSVGAESRPGEGSRFWFRLRLPAAGDAAPSTAEDELEALIVDDDAEQRRLLAVAARSLGWRVETEGGCLAAFDRTLARASSERPYDVLIVDWQMPELDGLALVRRLRAAHVGGEGPTVALMTAYDVEALRRLPGAELADAILAKPTTPSQLFDVVQAAMARRPGTRAQLLHAATPSSTARPARLIGTRILLVDDSSINLDVGQRILEREGARVTTATNGQVALELLRADPGGFDLVLMDVQMPVMDGVDATRHIREDLHLYALPIVALTAGAMVGEREHVLSAGMTEFITKPFDAETMIRQISELVRRSGPRVPGGGRADAASAAPIGAWPDLDGIDPRDARSRTAGDLALFRSVLERLLAEYGDLASCTAPSSADGPAIERLAARAHKLAGAAGAVAATTLHRNAFALERAGREGPAAAIAPALHTTGEAIVTLERAYSAWAASARVALEPGVAASEQQVRDLRIRLARRSLDALDLFRAIRTGLGQVIEPQAMEGLAEAIERLDFARAAELLENVTV